MEYQPHIPVTTGLTDCNGINGTGAEQSRRVFDALSRLGCEFYNFSPEFPLEQLPLSADTGNILPNAGLFHKVLGQSARSGGMKLAGKPVSNYQPKPEGDANFSFDTRIRSFALWQEASTADVQLFEGVASHQLAFFLLLADRFRPQFSYIDQFGENVGVSEAAVAKRLISRLFWYNVFGPGYLEKHGKEVFLNAPAWQVQDLGELGIAVRSTEKLSEWLVDPRNDLVDYFASHLFPRIKAYRAKRS